MERGEVWLVSLPDPNAAANGCRQPVVVVQADTFNRSQIQTLLAVVVTSNLRLANAPGNVRLSRRDSGLAKESVANVAQVVTLDKTALLERTGVLPAPLVGQIEAGLRLVLGL
jgi:mRNA interferase MazF